MTVARFSVHKYATSNGFNSTTPKRYSGGNNTIYCIVLSLFGQTGKRDPSRNAEIIPLPHLDFLETVHHLLNHLHTVGSLCILSVNKASPLWPLPSLFPSSVFYFRTYERPRCIFTNAMTRPDLEQHQVGSAKERLADGSSVPERHRNYSLSADPTSAKPSPPPPTS